MSTVEMDFRSDGIDGVDAGNVSGWISRQILAKVFLRRGRLGMRGRGRSRDASAGNGDRRTRRLLVSSVLTMKSYQAVDSIDFRRERADRKRKPFEHSMFSWLAVAACPSRRRDQVEPIAFGRNRVMAVVDLMRSCIMSDT